MHVISEKAIEILLILDSILHDLGGNTDCMAQVTAHKAGKGSIPFCRHPN